VQPTILWPGLRYRDAPGAIRFLVEPFGFEEVAAALFGRAQAAGAIIVQGLTDEDHGSRGFTVRDPEGVYWSFGTYAGA
jgi:uncharacterized glyoxalase superfamily protein PhnB